MQVALDPIYTHLERTYGVYRFFGQLGQQSENFTCFNLYFIEQNDGKHHLGVGKQVFGHLDFLVRDDHTTVSTLYALSGQKLVVPHSVNVTVTDGQIVCQKVQKTNRGQWFKRTPKLDKTLCALISGLS